MKINEDKLAYQYAREKTYKEAIDKAKCLMMVTHTFENSNQEAEEERPFEFLTKRF